MGKRFWILVRTLQHYIITIFSYICSASWVLDSFCIRYYTLRWCTSHLHEIQIIVYAIICFGIKFRILFFISASILLRLSYKVYLSIFLSKNTTTFYWRQTCRITVGIKRNDHRQSIASYKRFVFQLLYNLPNYWLYIWYTEKIGRGGSADVYRYDILTFMPFKHINASTLVQSWMVWNRSCSKAICYSRYTRNP